MSITAARLRVPAAVGVVVAPPGGAPAPVPARGLPLDDELRRRVEAVVTHACELGAEPGDRSLTAGVRLADRGHAAEALARAFDGLLARVAAAAARRSDRHAERVELLAEIARLRTEVADSRAESNRRRHAQVQAAMSRLRAIPGKEQLIAQVPVELGRCGFDRALLSCVEEHRWSARACHVNGDPAQAARILAAASDAREPLHASLVETEMVRRQKPILVDGPGARRCGYRAVAAVCRSTSYVAAPIVVDDRVVGFLHADCGVTGRAVDEDDRDVLSLFALLTAQAIQRAELRQRLDGLRERFEAITSAITATVDESIHRATELRPASAAPAAGTAVEPEPSSRVVAMHHVVDARLESLLTRRELEVLQMMAGGETNRGIAERLVISEGTVKSHVKHILRKLRAANRAEAVSRYMRIMHAAQVRRPAGI